MSSKLSQPRLGPFTLGERLGEGGMGRIFAARHDPTGLPVAVKLMTAARAQEARYIRGFKREVQAVARLRHRSISAVYEYGEVSGDEARDDIRIGSPWVAMELAAQGSLAELEEPISDWETLRRVLLEILDGLAYAHARGVIHRDLKPGNLLIHNGNVRIADFGIAHVIRAERDFDETEVHNATAGTASYMAPEQFFGRWRDYGPPTDLYALGCVAYELVSGNPPFVAEHRLDLAKMHSQDSLPPLKPHFGVPSDFEQWLEITTEKEHRHRYLSAADAARGLLLLGDPVDVEWSRPSASLARPDEETDELPPELFVRRGSDTGPTALTFVQDTTLTPVPVVAITSPGRRSGPARVPPLLRGSANAAAWDAQDTPMGLGLSLFGMREISLVGRDVERDKLWSALMRAHAEGHAEAIVLRGTAGFGKSRLAEWVCTRALEVGAAHVLRAQHSEGAAPAEAVRRMLSHHFMTFGLDLDAIRERVRAALTAVMGAEPGEYEVAALAQLAVPAGLQADGGFEFSSPKQRYAVVRGLLEVLAEDRPVILWLDDVQWGSDALALARFLMTSASVPLLLVLTVRDGKLGRRPLENSLLKHLTNLENTVECEIGALDGADLDRLAESLLPFSPALRDLVGGQANGSPLYAVQLIEHLIRRRMLATNDAGQFVLSPGAAALPATLEALCESRMDEILETVADPVAARDALELAAALGMYVEQAEWGEAQGEPVERLVEELVLGRVAQRALGGWTFTHAAFRDAVIRVSRTRGTWEERNRRCSETLQRLERAPSERRARLMVEAGDLPASIDLFLESAAALQLEGDYGRVGLLLDEVDALLGHAGLADSDERRGRASLGRIHVLRAAGDYVGAREQAERIIEVAVRAGWKKVEADATVELARILGVSMGEAPRALQLYDRARMLYEELADDLGQARVATGSSYVHIARANPVEAGALAERAFELFTKIGDARGLASSHYNLGLLARMKGELDEAKGHYRRCLELAERHGLRHTQGNAVDGIADIDRTQGNLAEAERGFQEGMLIWDSLDSETDTSAVNLALLAQIRDDGAKARELLEPRMASLEARGDKVLQQYGHFLLAAACTSLDDGPAYDAHLLRGRELFDEAPLPAGDLAELFEVASSVWLDRGDESRADGAQALVTDIRRLLEE